MKVRLCSSCGGTGRRDTQLTALCERCDGMGCVDEWPADEDLSRKRKEKVLDE